MVRMCFQPGVLYMLSLTKSDTCLTEGEPLGWEDRDGKNHTSLTDFMRNYTLLEGNIIFYYSTQHSCCYKSLSCCISKSLVLVGSMF